MKELKKCPFCNEEAILDYDKSKNSWFVECEGGCCVQNLDGLTRDEAVKLWNSRV